jgi:hypothetical protein
MKTAVKAITPLPSGRRRVLTRFVAATAVAVAIGIVATMPLTTLQGVDFVVSSHTVPAYVKVIAFVDRSVNYGRLAGAVTAQASTEEDRMRAVFEWTRSNIRDTPAGFPIIDDHVWNILIRGYGQDDQKADVFTTLLTYAGVPAYWILIGPKPELALSFVRIGDRWRVVDVANGLLYRTREGTLATAEELAADHSLARTQGPPEYRGLTYAAYFDRFAAPVPPDLTRPQAQMLIPRMWFLMKRAAGGGGRQWEIRPPSRELAGAR